MKSFREHLKLYLVSDRRWSENNILEDLEIALDHGVTCLQLREKEMDQESFTKFALSAKELTEPRDIPLIINDSIEVALASQADGLHIGQNDLSTKEARARMGHKILGVSVTSVEEAIVSQRDGADYLGVGAMFQTASKDDAQLVSMQTLKEIVDAVSIPVVAIGGINLSNIHEFKQTGIYGLAVISAILKQKNIAKASQEMLNETQRLMDKTLRKVLTIAGSDSSGGAGIQADLKTMSAHNCYGMSVITALTAQNTKGVFGIQSVDDKFISQQIDCIFTDIRPDAVKIGMVSSLDSITAIADGLRKYRPSHVVLDPVMISTSGHKLLDDNAINALKLELMPLSDLITPNLSEAELLAGISITSQEDMILAAKKIAKIYRGHILIKGGHLDDDASDLLYSNHQIKWFKGKRINNSNTHGTGCTLSSAIASNLAKGYPIIKSIEISKHYITEAINDQLDLGHGRGPLNHQYKQNQ